MKHKLNKHIDLEPIEIKFILTRIGAQRAGDATCLLFLMITHTHIVQRRTNRRRCIKLNSSISTSHFVHICELAQLAQQKKNIGNPLQFRQ